MVVEVDEPVTDLSPADIAAIRATSDRWMAAVRAGRWEDAAATFMEDATLLVAGTPHEGRDATYLAAFAETSQLTMVTFDRAFRGEAKPLILLEE